MSLSPGTRLGRYEIRSQIGAGGMGEVYLADDTLLRRPAAVKVLTGELARDHERLSRFEREAYAASTLNHPNIVTIYEIGTEAHVSFIATEYVEGESLREYLRGGPFELRELVDLAVQIASALSAAHQAGIIHRDIKPENVMVRKDGYVKVLDFGLAKLSLEEGVRADTEADTQLMIKTEPGRLMGTINYMSPEQARGQSVDERSDIFSLGVILYEMIAGRRPFSGETKSDILAAVLTSDPEPLANTFPDIPAELNRIVTKALKKDREQRYQTCKEMWVDLKSLRHDLESESRSGLPALRVPRLEANTIVTDGLARRSTAQPKLDGTATISELFVNEIKVHPRRSALMLTLLAVVIALGAIGLYRWTRPQPEAFQAMRLTKLTFTGDAVDGQISISPDGKHVVYVVREADHSSLWVRQVATSSTVQIVPAETGSFSGLTFSPDGSYVYYSRRTLDRSVLYQVPSFGGAARRLIDDAYGPISFSPDGKQIAFLRGINNLMVANIDGTGEQLLATCKGGESWLTPAWSPDDRVITTGLVSPEDNNTYLVEVELKEGKQKRLPSPPWLRLSGLSWLPDGKGLILSGRDLETKLSQIWFLSYPEGKPRRVTNDLSSYIGVSLTSDGKTLVSIQGERVSNIWLASINSTEPVRKLTSEQGKDEGMSGIALTPDSHVVYTARATGTQDLWMVDKGGSNAKQLTFNSRSNYAPAVSPDGRYIVFVSDRSGSSHIWRMDIDGANALQLTSGPGIKGQPVCTPDGAWVIYQITGPDRKTTLWKVSIEGGPPTQLSDDDMDKPTVSPDGRFVAGHYNGPKMGEPGIALFPLAEGAETRFFRLPTIVRSRDFRWASDGRGLIYIDSANRVYNLWYQSLDGTQNRQVTSFSSDEIFRFDILNDRGIIALARGHESSNVVLIAKVQ